MKVSLIAVMSLNGKITKGDLPPSDWASSEDQSFFGQMIDKHNFIVMGRKTYLQSKEKIKLQKGKLRIVLTKNPNHFQNEVVAGQLEFSSEGPKELIQRISKLGCTELLLVGGSHINSAFLGADLITDWFLTIEPLIFDSGLNLFSQKKSFKKLQLHSVKQLNSNGSLLLHFSNSL